MGHEQVDVIGDRSGCEQCAFFIFHNAANMGVEFFPNVIIKPWLPILRREDEMHQDFGE
jgi:hypothetical protein